MDQFEYPNVDQWKQRRAWIDAELQQAEVGDHLVSDHSTALFMDMQIAYCSGAWVSVIIMSISVIDSHLRETEAMDNKIGTAKLLTDYCEGTEIDWLRQLRNRFVHHNLDKPVLGMNDWFNKQEEMEENATKAIAMTIKALFQNPGV